MSKKNNNRSEPIVSSGAVPARARKHSPAKRTATPVVENSPSTDLATTAATPSAPVAELNLSNPVVTHVPAEEVARLAYSYWLARGCQGGSSEEDWLRAERELELTHS
jgi:hypothetical protein